MYVFLYVWDFETQPRLISGAATWYFGE